MGNENTAIHDLLAGVSRKAIADDPDDDILFAGSRKPEAPRPPVSARAQMFAMPAPPPPPAAAPFGAAMPKPATSPFANLPTQPAAAPARMASGTQPPPVINTAPGMPTIAMSALEPQVVPMPGPFVRQRAHAIEEAHATVRVSKSSAWRVVGAPRNPKLYAIPVGLFVVFVVLLGVYLTSGSKSAAAQVAAAPAPAPKAEPIVEPIAEAAAPAPAPEPVAVAAPVAAPAEEPKPQQDVIVPPPVVEASRFAAPAEPTVAPTVASVTATPIDAPAAVEPTVAVAEVTKPAKVERARDKRAAKRAGKRGKAKPRVAAAAPAAKAAKSEKAESLNGNGALAITSSAPREVWVDGRNSKRMTPLRVLLKPGKHTVTLFDKANGKAKSFDVEIKANTTTKVSK